MTCGISPGWGPDGGDFEDGRDDVRDLLPGRRLVWRAEREVGRAVEQNPEYDLQLGPGQRGAEVEVHRDEFGATGTLSS